MSCLQLYNQKQASQFGDIPVWLTVLHETARIDETHRKQLSNLQKSCGDLRKLQDCAELTGID